jgi:hypothetical protein
VPPHHAYGLPGHPLPIPGVGLSLDGTQANHIDPTHHVDNVCQDDPEKVSQKWRIEIGALVLMASRTSGKFGEPWTRYTMQGTNSVLTSISDFISGSHSALNSTCICKVPTLHCLLAELKCTHAYALLRVHLLVHTPQSPFLGPNILLLHHHHARAICRDWRYTCGH